MDISNILIARKKIQQNLLEFLDEENDAQEIETIFQNEINLDDIYELHDILLLISKISNNHHRTQRFINRIESIILFLKEKITNNFSNSEIFHIFKRNKRILLFLFEERIINPEKSIVQTMLSEKYKAEKYPNYFFKEINAFIDIKTKKEIEKENNQLMNNNEFDQNDEYFEINRKIGENDDYVCKLIREDSIDEFVTYVNRFNLRLSSKINSNSIFETNSFLMKNVPTLIEYAAFCGSIQIFKYLYLNNVNVNSSLWSFTIHGKNSELIHFLEENKIKPQDKFYQSCINESIKCHHNAIVEYIENVLLKKNKAKNLLISLNSIKYCNYSYFPNELNDQFYFFNLCKYDFISLVKFLLLNGNYELNSIMV